MSFGVLLIAGLGLVAWLAILAHQGSEQISKTQLGDFQHPPHVSIISLPNNTHFLRANLSDYPAYSVQIKLYDEKDMSHPIRTYGPEELPAHVATMDDVPWSVNDNLEHRFVATIVTRAGLANESLILRPAGNNQWMMACRIDGEVERCQPPDSYWPRDEKGQPIF